MPAWLLLFWCGLAAALVSEWLAAAVRPGRLSRRRGEAIAPRLMRGPRENALIAIAGGALLLAPVYGIVFELLNRADLVNGTVIGGLHGLIPGVIALAAAARSSTVGAAGTTTSLRAIAVYRARRVLARTVYGAVFGFLYVVPGP